MQEGSQVPGQRSGFSWVQAKVGDGFTQICFFAQLGSLFKPHRTGPWNHCEQGLLAREVSDDQDTFFGAAAKAETARARLRSATFERCMLVVDRRAGYLGQMLSISNQQGYSDSLLTYRKAFCSFIPFCEQSCNGFQCHELAYA